MKHKEALQLKHPNLDFSKFTATRSHDKSVVICKVHGEFLNSHKELVRQKVGCKKCLRDLPKVDKFLKGFCKLHGEYEYMRYNSPKCKICSVQERSDSHEDFINKLGNTDLKILSTYERSNKHILVENKYGILKVLPNHLLRCNKLTIGSAIDKTSYCINQFKEVHGDKYNYSQVHYTKAFSVVKIICPYHGIFQQRSVSHLRGSGCIKCAYEASDIGFTLEDFIRISSGRVCSLYLVKIYAEDESFIKIGITSRSLKNRLSKHKYEVISVIEDVDAAFIYNREKQLHKKLKKFKFNPSVKFNGHTECYSVDHLNRIINEFRRV